MTTQEHMDKVTLQYASAPTTTTDMSPELREKLLNLGWRNPNNTCWGRRVSGDMHGVTLERNGVEKYHAGPFTSVRVGDQMAIVRWG